MTFDQFIYEAIRYERSMTLEALLYDCEQLRKQGTHPEIPEDYEAQATQVLHALRREGCIEIDGDEWRWVRPRVEVGEQRSLFAE